MTSAERFARQMEWTTAIRSALGEELLTWLIDESGAPFWLKVREELCALIERKKLWFARLTSAEEEPEEDGSAAASHVTTKAATPGAVRSGKTSWIWKETETSTRKFRRGTDLYYKILYPEEPKPEKGEGPKRPPKQQDETSRKRKQQQQQQQQQQQPDVEVQQQQQQQQVKQKRTRTRTRVPHQQVDAVVQQQADWQAQQQQHVDVEVQQQQQQQQQQADVALQREQDAARAELAQARAELALLQRQRDAAGVALALLQQRREEAGVQARRAQEEARREQEEAWRAQEEARARLELLLREQEVARVQAWREQEEARDRLVLLQRELEQAGGRLARQQQELAPLLLQLEAARAGLAPLQAQKARLQQDVRELDVEHDRNVSGIAEQLRQNALQIALQAERGLAAKGARRAAALGALLELPPGVGSITVVHPSDMATWAAEQLAKPHVQVPIKLHMPPMVAEGMRRVAKHVASSSFGDVYKGVATGTNKLVAFKVFKALQTPARINAEIQRHQEACRNSRHVCGVVGVASWGEDLACLVLDFVDSTLHCIIHGERLVHKGLARKSLAFQLCTGVADVHDLGMVHRDIKPENVLVDTRGHLLLADFGLATEAADRYQLGDDPNLIATLCYRAPELLMGSMVLGRSPAVDVWGVGVVLYEMYARRRPFRVCSKEDFPDISSRRRLQLSRRLMLRDMVQLLGPLPSHLVDQVGAEVPAPLADGIAAAREVAAERAAAGRALQEVVLDQDLADLLRRMLAYDPAQRIGMREALQHPWFRLQHQGQLREQQEQLLEACGLQDEAALLAEEEADMLAEARGAADAAAREQRRQCMRVCAERHSSCDGEHVEACVDHYNDVVAQIEGGLSSWWRPDDDVQAVAELLSGRQRRHDMEAVAAARERQVRRRQAAPG